MDGWVPSIHPSIRIGLISNSGSNHKFYFIRIQSILEFVLLSVLYWKETCGWLVVHMWYPVLLFRHVISAFALLFSFVELHFTNRSHPTLESLKTWRHVTRKFTRKNQFIHFYTLNGLIYISMYMYRLGCSILKIRSLLIGPLRGLYLPIDDKTFGGVEFCVAGFSAGSKIPGPSA